jgi:hypothetical protein
MTNPFGKPIMSSKVMTLEEDLSKVMTGKERYTVKGGLLNDKQAASLMVQCKGLNLFWDCIDKAQLVKRFRGCGHVVVGSCMVLSRDGLSSYGHYFKPPYELHAWWQKNPGTNQPVIDIALPGLIMKGMSSSDELGPFIVGRKPIILAGRPLKWMEYRPYEII